MIMREATPEERRRFYLEEWNKREVPDFILHTISMREFGFDLDGKGPNNRYNQFLTVDQLGDFLRIRAPYSAYASVALYERPSAREGWLKAELALDIDAKDLPLKSCGCPPGSVCERCLDEARQVAKQFAEVLASDLGLRKINFIYSGRGFHIRVNDESVMTLEGNERAQLVDYVTGGVIPSDFTMALGYSKVFRERLERTFSSLRMEDLLEVRGMKRSLAQRLIQEKERAMEMIRKGKLDELSGLEGMGPKTFRNLLEFLTKLNSGFTDGKVTIDTKRILRLPSSLHSGVSMKCMVVQDIDRFKLEEAVPKFLREAAG
ncbi:MAG: DNA primase catalytic subunit PriS [Candidatus Hadarchaeum sp.]|uniref:DNA primase catalytic subunit PriS n=1 Tax=Candidatus Hadarchaeum sp. TaxID=2883567 RepID=UPI00317013AE